MTANIVRKMDGKPTQPFRYRPIGLLVSIGHNKAVIQIYQMRMTGFLAWLLWRGIYRQPGMPDGILPVAYTGEEPWPSGDQALTHLVAISMDSYGFPIGLFTTNRWVTGEAWYCAEDIIAMLNRFHIDHAYPSWPVNIWLTQIMVLFRPQVEWLLRERDRIVKQWQSDHPDIDVYEDRNLEITAYLAINVEEQIRNMVEVMTD
ncbi:MAG: hypothetical protein Q8N35_11135 [Methylococcaceae bacterium]|nr:hypothetical protein [Methylococcaceae bacterium]MDP2394341.1 hypothetical protein [Methylococcaceae bacterium]MDP3020130.1 hypothetical protein [Methylococcaceae bacterium]MDP3391204.1 hypothetical protein [Methylococcaceae bacterium]MDP3932574.1 hypothetical protein [Methylococcaceae bacterium]